MAAVVGIWMAYEGYGVWALVAQNLVNKVIDTTVLWFTVKWRPKLLFSIKRLKGLVSYGWKLLASSLLDTVYNNLRQLIIGKLYSSSDLAFYNRGKQFPNFVITNINTSIDSVLFPAMSSQQDDTERVRSMTRRSIKISSYIMWPLMMGLAFTATSIVSLVLTDKWLPCVPFLRIFCFVYVFFPIHTANLNAIKAMGRSDLFLKLEVIKKVIGLIVLVCTMWFGVEAMTYSLLVTNIISQIINAYPNRQLLGYSYIDQIKDILPSIAMALFMGFCILAVELLNLGAIATLMIQIVLGIIIYIWLSIIFKVDSFYYLMDMVKEIKNR